WAVGLGVGGVTVPPGSAVSGVRHNTGDSGSALLAGIRALTSTTRRPAGRGLLQLNPFLRVAIGSADHERVQREWLGTVGDTFLLPGPDHPAEWREIGAAAKDAAKKARQAAVGENAVPMKRVPGQKAQPGRSAAL
ncbi:hypothetical protein ACWEO5_38525, partial [Kitasatospora sp. NPDC004272]